MIIKRRGELNSHYSLGVIYIDERPPVIQCFFMGIQHVLAMFGSTVIGK